MKIMLDKHEIDEAITQYVSPMLAGDSSQGPSVDVTVSRTQGGYTAEVSVGHAQASGADPIASPEEAPAPEEESGDVAVFG